MAKLAGYKDTGILDVIREKPNISSKEVYERLSDKLAYATVKRGLQHFAEQGLLTVVGAGKATRYRLSEAYGLSYPIDLDEYFKKEIDERQIRRSFNHALIDILRDQPVFTTEELDELNASHQRYREKTLDLPKSVYQKELERLAIDLSWKSSQIEGNTYSLLETERLLKDRQTAAGKTRDEATMLLNHKEALDFIIENPTHITSLSIARIEEIHSILVKDLNVERNLRRRAVGITGTNYKPLDNEFQIREALEATCRLVNDMDNVFSKALLSLVLLSYIQPFVDGNKRTARIIINAILINSAYCPLSFRTVDPIDYKKAMLLFYEQNNISAFKRIFIEQFRFAVQTYF